jgi:hypothetical protein
MIAFARETTIDLPEVFCRDDLNAPHDLIVIAPSVPELPTIAELVTIEQEAMDQEFGYVRQQGEFWTRCVLVGARLCRYVLAVFCLTALIIGVMVAYVIADPLPKPADSPPPAVPPTNVGPPPAAPPAPVAPPPIAPSVTIKMPAAAEVGHAVHVVLENTGGPIRDQYPVFDPPLDDDEWAYDFKTMKLPDGTEIEVKDETRFHFTAPAGHLTVSVLCIGKQPGNWKNRGYDKPEAEIQVNPEPRQVVPVAPASPAPSPQDTIKNAVPTGDPRTRGLEKQQVARAGHDTAARIRQGQVDGLRAIDDWAATAYLRMGKAFTQWNVSVTGRSFFATVAGMFADAQGSRDFNPANFVDSVSAVLEGK